MPFITFIYKIGEMTEKIYYGKYCTNYISDDHEGLDIDVKYSLIRGLNEYNKQNNICLKINEKIIVGILSFSSDNTIPTYSSNDEIQCFDFYRDYEKKIYINSKLINLIF